MIFPTASAAKDFLAEKVVAQARRDGVPLSEAERKMMYFSVEELTVANEVADQFPDGDADYERKISSLLEHSYKNEQDKESFDQAFNKLAEGDHYLSVMAPAGCARAPNTISALAKIGNSRLVRFLATPSASQRIQDRSARDLLLLVASALALIGIMFLFGLHWEPAKESFWRWWATR